MKVSRSVSVLGLCFSVILSIVVGGATGQAAPSSGPEVFANVLKLDDQDLKEALTKTLRSSHVRRLGYREARTAIMGKLYLVKNADNSYHVRCVYCQKDFSSKSVDGVGPNSLPDDKILNVEHTWPQSKFAGSEQSTMKSDLHHLFPSDSQINSQRGNFRFGDVQGREQEIKCDSSHLGAGPDGRPQFEPPVVHKGNVARALFYFSTRYSQQIDPLQEKYLREWHQQDPVSQEDVVRNAEIEKLQGVRNPFIDHPEFVDRISDF